MLAETGVDQTIIKKIVGHSGAMTLTEKVYTHFDIKVPLKSKILSELYSGDLYFRKLCFATPSNLLLLVMALFPLLMCAE